MRQLASKQVFWFSSGGRTVSGLSSRLPLGPMPSRVNIVKQMQPLTGRPTAVGARHTRRDLHFGRRRTSPSTKCACGGAGWGGDWIGDRGWGGRGKCGQKLG